MNQENKVWRVIEGEALVLDLQEGSYYSINPVGTAILKGLIEGHSVNAIADSVASTFTASPQDVLHEVTGFVQELQEASLLDLGPGSADDDEDLGELVYAQPKLHRYDQFNQVVSYSPDEL